MDRTENKRISGRFALGEVIGRGAAATVYAARDIQDGRPVALKVLSSAGDPSATQRFLQEAQVIARLASPHTVRIYGYGETPEGVPYLALERLQGRSLGALVDAEGPLSWRQAVVLAAQVAASLQEAHEAGVVHRDLKPGNVFVVEGPDGAPAARVLDFGLARFNDASLTASLTETGMTVGSPAFMAPEQALGMAVDGRADLYALGSLLFTMLVGVPPFVGDDPVQVLVQACEEPAPALVDVNPALDCPPELSALVAALLSKTPEQRPASAAAVRGLLEALVARSASATIPTHAPRAWSEHLPGWSLPVSMIVCVGLAFGGMLLARTSSGEPTREPVPMPAIEEVVVASMAPAAEAEDRRAGLQRRGRSRRRSRSRSRTTDHGRRTTVDGRRPAGRGRPAAQ